MIITDHTTGRALLIGCGARSILRFQLTRHSGERVECTIYVSCSGNAYLETIGEASYSIEPVTVSMLMPGALA